MNHQKLTRVARIAALAFASSIFLTGCMNSEDGPQLSDDEKIQKMNQGRESYMQGMKGGGSKKAPDSGSK